MGWNKQSGDAWVLMRSELNTDGTDRKALALRVTSLLTIEDAQKLAQALVDEIWAAKQSEGKQPETREQWKARNFSLHYGAEQDFASAVLKNWDERLGEYKSEYDYAPQFDEDDGCPND